MEDSATNQLATTQSPSELRKAILKLKPRWRVEDIERFEYLSGGYSNENFRFEYGVGAFVLRLPSRTRPFVDRSLELSFYRKAAAALPLPELVAFDVVTGMMLTRFHPGALLADASTTPESLASYLRGIHAALPPSGRLYDPMALSRQFLGTGGAPADIRALAARSWQPETLVACHNDLNPWNVILATRERWITLDWEWFGDNDPLFDLVTLHQGLCLADDTLSELIELWQQAPARADRIERCLIAFWLREYAWAWAEQHHGNIRSEIEAQLANSREKLAQLTS